LQPAEVFELRQRGIGNVRPVQVQVGEVRQVLQGPQAVLAHTGVSQAQYVEVDQVGEVPHGAVPDSCVIEVQLPDVAASLEGGQAGGGDGRAAPPQDLEPAELGQRGKPVVVDALVAVQPQRHQPGQARQVG